MSIKSLTLRCDYDVGLLEDYARLRDLAIVPVPESYDQWYAEAIIFRSGKPTLILPEKLHPRPFELKTIVIAWDFSRRAAHAIADSMPILERAKNIRIVTVTNEKVIDTKRSVEELTKNLSRHSVDVVLDKVDADGRPISAALESHALSCGADLLVMGAYGLSLPEVRSWRCNQEHAVETAPPDLVLTLTGMSTSGSP